jgi:hypothetical protein
MGCVANALFQSFSYSLPGFWEEGGMFKGRHFDRSVILLCVRWYLAYNLSLRNLEEMMAERGVSVDHATVHISIGAKEASAGNGIWMRLTSKSEANGNTSIVPSIAMATRSSSGSANGAI